MENTIENMKILLGGAAKVANILSDEELAKFIINSENVYRSASKAAFAITAFYTHKASLSVDILSFQNTARANAFRELAIELGNQAVIYSTSDDNVEFIFVSSDSNGDDPDDSIFHKKMFFPN